MDIMKIMNSKSPEIEEFEKIKETIEKNKAVIKPEETRNGGRYEKAWNKLCQKLYLQLWKVYVKEMIPGFPKNDVTKSVLTDCWNRAKKVLTTLAISQSNLDLFYETLNNAKADFRRCEIEALKPLGIVYEMVDGIDMPVLISDK